MAGIFRFEFLEKRLFKRRLVLESSFMFFRACLLQIIIINSFENDQILQLNWLELVVIMIHGTKLGHLIVVINYLLRYIFSTRFQLKN